MTAREDAGFISVSDILSGTKVLVSDSDLKSQLKEKGFDRIENKALVLSTSLQQAGRSKDLFMEQIKRQ